MPDILRRICAVKRDEIARLRERGTGELEGLLRRQSPPRGFRAALTASDRVALVAEVKKASPSKGVIREDFDPAAIARSYERGGARCLSVLTDTAFFQGRLEDLAGAREGVSLPALRKDFILDPIQVLQSRAWGADCVLLIVAALADAELRELLAAARNLGMDALVEVHDGRELERAVAAGADTIGVNNRDLRTFEVDLETTRRLAAGVPDGVVLVAESGICSRADIESLTPCGIDAVLVGEGLMRADDIEAAARELSDV
ncbi:MAG: indole-3-glycerol phosphate synthase TrpC [Candidatus Brocadiia bacterium]|nr:indole-3-glycerol phosphate synthase TrpC [Candidatus Brocadiia bacterium]